MVENLKIALISIATGITTALAAFGINVEFLSTEVIAGIATTVATVIALILGKKKES